MANDRNGVDRTTAPIVVLPGLGKIRSIPTLDFPANTEILVTVPAGVRWRLLGFRATLVTDGNAANRLADLIVDDGTNIVFQRSAVTTQAASLTYSYMPSPGADVASNSNNQIMIPLSTALVLPPRYRIRTSVLNRQVGDDWSAAQLFVEEWPEP